MSLRLALVPLLLLAAAPAVAQDAYAGGYSYAPGYAADGQSVESIEVFFEPLSHYGRWLDTRYGRVWAPNVPRDWRPYTVGHWEDGPYGPTWRSDEPFGWAVFHYGRWAFDPAIGWVWLPDTVWGPGWVAWRDGDDVTGWAPLPPQVSIGFAVGSGFAFNDWGYDQWYQPGWVYVPRGYLYARSLRSVYFPYQRNRDFWERTRGVTRYDRFEGQIVNRSFGDRRAGRDDRGGGFSGRDGRSDDRRDFGGLRGRDPRDNGWQAGRDRNDGDRGRDVRAADQGRDVHQGDPRDGRYRDNAGLRAQQGYDGGAPSPAPYATPRGGSVASPYERRDGFVPGTPPPRGYDRGVPPPAGAARAPAFAPPPGMRAPAPVAPPVARPAPAPAPRPAPPPPPRQGREPANPNERPR